MSLKVRIKEHPFIYWLRTSPIIKTAIAAIPMTWHGIVIGFYGKQSGFLDLNGDITSKGRSITIAVYAFVILYVFIINVIDRIRIKHESDYASIAKFVLDEVLFLYDKKLDNQQKTFLNGESDASLFSYNVVERINQLLIELIRCVEHASDLEYKYISASIFYTFDTSQNQWHMIEQNYCDAFDGVIRDVIIHPESFARYLNEVHEGSLCILWDKYKDGINHKDKKTGKKAAIYKENQKDIDTGKRGSIVGWKFKIKQEQITYIEAMMFISTYGSKLDESFKDGKRKAVRKCLVDLILPYFQDNLKAELMHLYAESNRK